MFDGLVEEVTYQTEKEIPKASKEEIVEEIREDLKISEKDLKNPALEFQCHLCYKQFSRKYYLNRHVKNHDKKPSTICYICGKTLKSPINLHMKAVHENVRPFRCDICNKTFREKNRLRLHMMVHTGN